MSGANGVGVVRFIRESSGANAEAAPDGELVRRFAAGADERAFRALVARHGPVVWAVCRRLLRNHHDAEDAFQATLLVLARGAGGIRSGSAVGGWLCGVAARVASRVRSARRAEPTDAEPAAGHPDGALGELTVREAEALLYEELGRLPERYRAALVLCCLEGLSRDEAASQLGWSANRLKNALEQGRELLRARLARRGVALGLPLLAGMLCPPAAVAAPLVEAAVRHATGATAPPAAIGSLADGVTQAMWVAKWKWAAAACAAASLAVGGVLAAGLGRPPAAPEPPAAKPGLVLAPAPAQPKKAAAEKELTDPVAIAAAFLQHVIDGKPERALKLAEPRMIDERDVKKIQVSGLKRVKLVMLLINDERVTVVTERAQLVRGGGPRPEDAHVVVTLEKKSDVPWVVRESDIRDEKWVLREIDDYLDGKFNFDPKEDRPGVKKDAKEPNPARGVAVEFLKLALAGKTDAALKLAVPGTVSENKVGEIKKAGYTSTKVAAVLLNDTRVEVVFGGPVEEKGEPRHLVLMLTKSKDGAWRVKDVDARDDDGIEARAKLYLAGQYNDPAAGP